MPRLWDRSKRAQRTPFSDLLADYLDAHRWMRPKNLAVDIGLSATTIQRYLNGEVVPHDPRILQQISAGTGIPLGQLYAAAGLWLPAPLPVEAPVPPPAPQPLTPQQYAQSMQPIPSAFDEAVARIQASWPHEAAEVMIKALYKTAGRDYWQVKIEEWKNQEHDIAAIGTLELPAIPPGQPAAQSAESADAAHMQSQSLITR